MANETVLNFDDLTPQEVPFIYKGKQYLLKEATGDAVCKYRNFQLKNTRMVDGKVTGVGDMADAAPLLLSLCLTEVVKAPDGSVKHTPVQGPVIRSWPNKVLDRLFAKAKEISELDDGDTAEALEKRIAADQEKLARLRGAEEAAKNELALTTDGSV